MLKTNILLFDIPTALGVPTSPYTWRVRLFMNYRKLEYRTRWVPTAEIEMTCRFFGIPPTGEKPSGEPHFTLPAIIDYTQSSSNPVVLSDSYPILQYLEHQYPSPSNIFFPSGFEQNRATFSFLVDANVIPVTGLLYLTDLFCVKLPRDRKDFQARLEASYKKSMEDLVPKGVERERSLDILKNSFSKLSEILGDETRSTDRSRVSYPNIVLCSCLIWIRYTSPDDGWATVSSWNGGRWRRHIEAFEDLLFIDQLRGCIE